tara:strand:- start:392 stop:967 length:576 start_codon:yes stop_codon:yes gene_type:complete
MINLAIFISGRGSNAKNIIQYFDSHSKIKVKLLVSNNKKSTLMNILEPSITYQVYQKQEFLDGNYILRELKKKKISFIVLAGFLLKIPPIIITKFNHRILNIHPSLLPKFGGKGMYGMNVHDAVFNAKKKETGITIHEVNKEYDKGIIIFQAKCSLSNNDKPIHIQKKVQQLEHKFYPIIIENYILLKNEN